MTNGDRFRNMTDEQLAEYLFDMRIDGGDLIPFCVNSQKCEDMLDIGELIPEEWCKECLLNWIRKDSDQK